MPDLVLLALGGVQRFVSESRTTADVAGASGLVQALAECAASKALELLGDSPEPCGLVIPGADAVGSARRGSTNKVAFLAPDGSGPELAMAVADAVRRDWSARVGKVFPNGVVTPGMPDVSWVSVAGSADPEHYGQLWERARAALVARRRARVFSALPVVKNRSLCSQSPQLAAVEPPRDRRRHERHERLSAAGWVKRLDARVQGVAYPSTVAVASRSFRLRLIEAGRGRREVALVAAVERLAEAVAELGEPREHRLLVADVPVELAPLAGELGPWVYPEQWDVRALVRDGVAEAAAKAGRGQAAARALLAVARQLVVPPPSPYFAVVGQDLDHLGKALGGLTLERHRSVSTMLAGLAEAQWVTAVELPVPAQPVYAGGHDFLAFCALWPTPRRSVPAVWPYPAALAASARVGLRAGGTQCSVRSSRGTDGAASGVLGDEGRNDLSVVVGVLRRDAPAPAWPIPATCISCCARFTMNPSSINRAS